VKIKSALGVKNGLADCLIAYARVPFFPVPLLFQVHSSGRRQSMPFVITKRKEEEEWAARKRVGWLRVIGQAALADLLRWMA
jgi:hypothetical protein